MNEQPTYEQLIAQKLEQLPVPNMADAIWADIEQQLDSDMPSDEGDETPEPPQPQKPDGTVIGASIKLGLVVVVAVVIFFAVKKLLKRKADNTIPPVQQVIPVPSNDSVSVPAPVITPTERPGEQKIISTPVKDSAAVVPPDTTVNALPSPVIPVPVPDTTKKSIPPVIPDNKPPVTDTVKKKSKGVKGISDNDYRIAPKKDSMKPD